MKKQKKILISIVLFFVIILLSNNVFAFEFSSDVKIEFSERFENYLNLSDEEREGLRLPRGYVIPQSTKTIANPLKLVRLLGNTNESSYSLIQDIPKNMVIKDQKQTGSCWTFAILASLESNLALKYNDDTVYDFSERHMEYATSQSFLNNVKNPIGFLRDVGSGGGEYLSLPYLTNGSGAIAEADMPFENNEDKISITEIQNKEVITQLNDTISFWAPTAEAAKTNIMSKMKDHIKNYGALSAGIHGANLNDTTCYNNDTGALYCNDASVYGSNHAVAIVGWDDNYSVENFVENNRPRNNGAWIIKNSWGTGETFTLQQMKEFIYEQFPEERENYGWTAPESISDEVAIANFRNWGYTIDENNVATLKIGNKGLMYVSYEDVNIYMDLTGIVDADARKKYDNIYQYGEFEGTLTCDLPYSKIYLSTINDKKTSGKEYLTQVAITVANICTCKVYVNPNGTSMDKNDLQLVQLKAGETETFEAGYHTLDFLNPVEITGANFVVVLEIQSEGRGPEEMVPVIMEFNPEQYAAKVPAFAEIANALSIYNNVIVETGRTFWSYEEEFNKNNWCDTATMCTLTEGIAPDFNTTIKAFTVSETDILESIEVTTPPTKTIYFVGEDFDPTGMIVKARYGNEKLKEITDYTISNGTNLKLGQTNITISYEEKTTTQSIQVLENLVQSIDIITPPTKTQYFAGESFDKSGMQIEATFADKTKQTITDYTIIDGEILQNGQTSVTITYEGKTATQPITVKNNTVVKIEIVEEAAKLNYVVGQNFDSSGMRVIATYESGIEKEITNYIIKNGTNLQVGQTEVIIEFEGQTVTQAITVVEKNITGISVKTMPTKTQYTQNKEELDLTGGVIKISYDDNTTEDMLMTSEQITASGFDKTKTGTQVITLTYRGKTTQFNVEIKEEPKPENSKFDNVQGNVTRIRAYYFSDDNTKDRTVINVNISNVIKATVNDKMEYYYYLSGNQQEKSITDWVKISSIENEGNNLSFEINTKEISNYGEVADAENMYLYIKEVATRNEMESEAVTSSILLEVGDVKIEKYIDGQKKEEVDPEDITNPTPGEKPDDTLAPETIPNAGKNIFIVFIAFIIFIIGRFSYSRYKDIKIK